ncbi:MAG: Maf family protein [candidate division WOR-3 bacterium]|nr:Maf family protein [candidate division WOR-3 bacterium]
MKLYLASTSPRRRQLLQDLGIPFSLIKPAFFEPEIGFSQNPRRLAVTLALLKALSCTPKVKNGIIIGTDTIVVIRNRILGKPANPAAAKRMLKLLSNKTHQVITGIALIKMPEKRICTGAETTRVTFRALSDEEIKSYISTPEPYDKAGAYAIQGRAGLFVERISGCYLNVIGLPVSLLLKLLQDAGWKNPLSG